MPLQNHPSIEYGLGIDRTAHGESAEAMMSPREMSISSASVRVTERRLRLTLNRRHRSQFLTPSIQYRLEEL